MLNKKYLKTFSFLNFGLGVRVVLIGINKLQYSKYFYNNYVLYPYYVHRCQDTRRMIYKWQNAGKL